MKPKHSRSIGLAVGMSVAVLGVGALLVTGVASAGTTAASTGKTLATAKSSPVGPRGLTGARGARGLLGHRGPVGFLGLTGLTGATGATGASGAIGATGLMGLTGAAGANGSNGSAGSIGNTGPNGNNGSSVHTSVGAPTGTCITNDTDIDLANGDVYTCTATAWVNSGSSIAGPSSASSSTTVVTTGVLPTDTTITALCPGSEIAIGGGGDDSDASATFANSFPSNNAGAAITTGVRGTAWTVTFSLSTGFVSAFAICSS